MHLIHWNATKLTYTIFLLAITKTFYDLRQYQSYRGIRESEKYVPNAHVNARSKWWRDLGHAYDEYKH